METQRQAWNRGDLATFVSFYDSSMTFCGSDGITRGTDDLLAHYRARYPTAEERGVLTFHLLQIRPIGNTTALVVGQYVLDRDKPTSGFFSLLVQRPPGPSSTNPPTIRIIHDHTSETPAHP